MRLTATVQDQASLGARTVQLIPYLDTPNNGGEYKVWITPVDRYDADAGKHGFVARFSKTDNFKIREIEVAPPPPPPDEPAPCCGDGNVDAGEQCDDGNTTNGDGCNNDCRLSNGQPCSGDNQCSSGACDSSTSRASSRRSRLKLFW